MSSPLAPSLRRVAFLSTYPPRLCGIATFAANLHAAIAGAAPELECFALAMSDGTGRRDLSAGGPPGDPRGRCRRLSCARPTFWPMPTPTCCRCSMSTASSAAPTEPYLLAAAGAGADARGHDPAHGARATDGRAAPRHGRDRPPLGAPRGDDPALPGCPGGGARRADGARGAGAARHSRYAAPGPGAHTRASSAPRAARCC